MLERCYPNVESLHVLITREILSQASTREESGSCNDESEIEWTKDYVVGYHSLELKCVSSDNQVDLVHVLIRDCLLSKQPNVLTLGYRLIGSTLRNDHPNHQVMQVCAQEWQKLLVLIGSKWMYLLLKCGIFKTIGSNQIQIAGHPITDTKSLKRPSQVERISKKIKSLHLSKILVPWSTVLYGKPIYSNGAIVVGLPPKHPIHRPNLVKTIFPLETHGKHPIFELEYTGVSPRVEKAKLVAQMVADQFQKLNLKSIVDRHTPHKREGSVLDQSIPIQNIQQMVSEVVKKLCPVFLFANATNRQQLLQNIHKILLLRRFETLSMEQLIKNIKLSQISWLSKKISKSHPPQEIQRRQTFFCELVWWLVDFILCFLKSNFYITESSVHKNRLLFFRHKTWQQLNGSTLKTLLTTNYLPADTNVGSRLRFLPKQNGFRPIVNLGKSSTTNTNKLLQNLFSVLDYERKSNPNLIQSGCLGQDDIYNRLLEFKLQKSGPFYFCKVDIKQCFDSIRQDILLGVVQDVLKHCEYLIKRYSFQYLMNSQVKREFKRQATESDQTHQEFMDQLMETKSHVVFVDQVYQTLLQKDKLLLLLKDHILNHTVRVGNQYFKQIVGIPQGSVVSSLLCSFYYGYLEQELKSLLNPDCLLMRYVDDYLLVTTDLERCKTFCIQMHYGFPDYGCSINTDKTLVNFDLEIDGTIINKLSQKRLGWCGLSIDTTNLNITGDYNRLFDTPLVDTITCVWHKTPGQTLITKMTHLLKPKFHPLFIDPHLNCFKTILVNSYQNFLVTCIKMLVHYDNMHHKNESYLLKAIQKLCMEGSRQFKKRNKKSLGRQDVYGLGILACAQVLRSRGFHILSSQITEKAKRYSQKLVEKYRLDAISHRMCQKTQSL